MYNYNMYDNNFYIFLHIFIKRIPFKFFSIVTNL